MTMDWETAFFEQYQDACIGRMLRGIIHNLNGANQAFSLQAALFTMMFTQADKLLTEAAASRPDCGCVLAPVQDLLSKRAVLAVQMEEKVATSQRIVARVLPLANLYAVDQESVTPLATIVDLEMEILAADPFFKHRLEKRIQLAPDLPPLRHHRIEVHTILFTLLENSLVALQGSAKAELGVAARVVTDQGLMKEALLIKVRDNGHGVPPEVADRLFDPFVSTREGGLGVGLFLARKMATAMGATITFTSVPSETCFQVTIPLAAVV
jgi:signal transduction histidine kinase